MPLSRKNIIFLLTVICGYIFYYSITYNDQLAGSNSDDAVYLLLADLYTFKTGSGEAVYDILRINSYFPPLYPMILGLFGGDSMNFPLATSLTVFMQVTSFFLAAVWTLGKTSNYYLAYAVFLLMLLLPGSIIFSQELWSEYLFMVFLYAIFYLFSRGTPNRNELIGVSLLIGLSCLTRSIGIALCIAFIIYLSLKRPKYSMRYMVLSLLPFIFWNFIRGGDTERTSYFKIATSTIVNFSPSQLIETGLAKIRIFGSSLYWLFSIIDNSHIIQVLTGIVLFLFLTLVIIRLVRRTINFEFDAIFVFLYLGIVVIWPYDSIFFVSRFLYPLVPTFIYYFVEEYRHIYPKKFKLCYGYIIISILIAVVISPSTYHFISRAYADVRSDLMPYRRDRQWLTSISEKNDFTILNVSKFLISSLNKVQDIVPANDCIFAIQSPFVMLHTKRVTSVMPVPEVTDIEFAEEITACNFILTMPVYDIEGKFPEHYPMQRLKPENYTITASYNDPNIQTSIYLLKLNTDTFTSQ